MNRQTLLAWLIISATIGSFFGPAVIRGRPLAFRVFQAQSQGCGQTVIFAIRMRDHANAGILRSKAARDGQGFVRVQLVI